MLLQLPTELLASIISFSGCIGVLWTCGDQSLQLRLSSVVSSLTMTHIPMEEFVPPTFLSQLPKLKAVKILCAGNMFGYSSNSIKALRALPSTLESLSIDCKDSNLSFALPAESKDYGRLALKYIEIGTIFPHLTSLTLRWMNQEILSVLPPGLTSLTSPTFVHLPFMSLLPRTMIYFNIGIACSGDDVLNELAHMPPNMAVESISVYSHHAQVLDHFSRAGILKSVQLLNASAFTSSDINRLPRSITDLDLPLDANLQEYANDTLNWPPNLASLHIYNACERGILSILPRHLKTLSLRLADSGPTCLYLEELPPHLEAFDADSNHPIQFVGKLPSSVRRCFALNATGFNSAFLPDTLESLSLHDCKKLIRAQDLSLPSMLQSVSLPKWHSSDLQHLPSGLATLQLEYLQLASEDSHRLFSLPPTSLKSLSIHGIRSFAVLLLPYHANDLPLLTTLDLPNLPHLPLASLQNLPRSMTSLKVQLDDEDKSMLAFLPPNLTEFRMTPEIGKIQDLGDLWPPELWRILVGTPASHHVRQLRQRLEASRASV